MLRVLSYRSLLAGVALALAPFALQAQAATTCADGTTSTATGRGACSGHGGVAKKSTKAAKSDAKADTKAAKADAKTATKAAKSETKEAKADVKADTKTVKAADKLASKSATADVKQTAKTANNDASGATAKCKDGTYSHAATHRGACSRHGGVAEWLKS